MAAEHRATVPCLIDTDELKGVAKRPVEWFFRKYADHTFGKGDDRYIFIDNGAPILAVAHLDTVVDPGKKFNFNVYTRDGIEIIKCPSLDDRVGVYIITVLLPKLLKEGDKWADILLTIGEESGKTTARQFKTDKKYNWMVEFDRMGSSMSGSEDAVLYTYISNDFKKVLAKYGFERTGHGSFTDISALTNLGCRGLNVAVGYQNNHSTRAWMRTIECEANVAKFLKLYRAEKDTMFAFTYTPPKKYNPDDYRYPYGGGYYSSMPQIRLGDFVYKKYGKDAGKELYVVIEQIGYLVDVMSLDSDDVLKGISVHALELAEDICEMCYTGSDPILIKFQDKSKNESIIMCRACWRDHVSKTFTCIGCEEEVDIMNISDVARMLCEDCDASIPVLYRDDLVTFKRGMILYRVTRVLENGNVVIVDAGDVSKVYTGGGRGYPASMFDVVAVESFITEVESGI